MLEPGTIVWVCHFGDVETPSFSLYATEEAAYRDFFERADQAIAEVWGDLDDELEEEVRNYQSLEPGDIDNRYRAALKVFDLVSDVCRVERRFVH